MNMFLFLFSSLFFSLVTSQDCVLTAIVSIYECRAKCLNIYGSATTTERRFYNSSSGNCQPTTDCPSGWTYLISNNTCILDAGQKNNVINGVIMSSNVEDFQFVYATCNNGYFQSATCFCNPGWKSSLTQIIISPNVSRIAFCDVQVSRTNLTASTGQNKFNGYSWADRRSVLDEVFPGEESWVNSLVIVSLVVYVLVAVLSIHWSITKAIKARKEKRKGREGRVG